MNNYDVFKQIKQKYPDHLVFFRLGDFWETFGDDAVTTSNILDLYATTRTLDGAKVKVCGFPFVKGESYIPKLILAEQKVITYENMPKLNKIGINMNP